jgi:hypothetical protein
MCWGLCSERLLDADGLEQDEVAAAEPSIDEKTAKLVSKGRWSVPGYKVRTTPSRCSYGIANRDYRRNSATFPCYRRLNRVFFFMYSSIVDSRNAPSSIPAPKPHPPHMAISGVSSFERQFILPPRQDPRALLDQPPVLVGDEGP